MWLPVFAKKDQEKQNTYHISPEADTCFSFYHLRAGIVCGTCRHLEDFGPWCQVKMTTRKTALQVDRLVLQLGKAQHASEFATKNEKKNQTTHDVCVHLQKHKKITVQKVISFGNKQCFVCLASKVESPADSDEISCRTQSCPFVPCPTAGTQELRPCGRKETARRQIAGQVVTSALSGLVSITTTHVKCERSPYVQAIVLERVYGPRKGRFFHPSKLVLIVIDREEMKWEELLICQQKALQPSAAGYVLLNRITCPLSNLA